MARAYTYTILAVVLWTTGPVGSKAALLASRGEARLTPVQVAFWAIGIGWVALAATLLVRRRLSLLTQVAGRGWVVLAAMGVFGWAGYPVAMNFAYQRLSLADAMVIGNLSPVFVTILQGAAFGRLVRPVSGWEQKPERRARPSAARVTGALALCLMGVAIIATEGRLSALGQSKSIEGALAAVFAALAWGIYSNLGRFVPVRQGAEHGSRGDIQNLVAMAVGLATMAGCLAWSGELALPSGYRTAFYLGALGPAWVTVWAPILAMAFLNYAAGYTLWLNALEAGGRVGEAHKLPPLTYLLLVLCVAVGWVVLRESFGGGFWEGAAFIAAGNALNLWPTRARGRGSAAVSF